jgi:probable phosphoglycerate mutase
MTTIILVRHGAHRLLDRVLVGRRLDMPLSADGVAQAERIAALLAGRGVTQIKASPQFRALQTARPLAEWLGKPIEIAREFNEVDFGAWAGRSFEALRSDPHWRRWNSHRGSCRPPGGETMRELQGRVLDGLARIAAASPAAAVAVFTHAEPIRAAILHYRGMELREFARIQVDPGSLTTMTFDHGQGVIARENEAVDDAMVAA